MRELSFTLLSDGSSDRAIMPLLRRLLEEHCRNVSLRGEWADLARLPDPPSRLVDRIRTSLRLYPCELLFVHRDAEGQSIERREEEVAEAVRVVSDGAGALPPAVEVIPVRMSEAWLLVDEQAIRRAAGNPNGTVPLDVPRITRLEGLPDPKTVLHDALQTASGLEGVRRKKFPARVRAHRIADYFEDLSFHRELPAFRILETKLVDRLSDLGLVPTVS
jgi:hypothetical protein